MKRLRSLGLPLIAVPVMAVISAPIVASDAGAVQVRTASVTAAQMEAGEALYRKHCRFCHGTKGTSGKRLSGNEKVADAGYVAHVILVGPGYMTPFAEHLSDEEIATIATYVRNSWGNSYGPVESGEVSALR